MVPEKFESNTNLQNHKLNIIFSVYNLCLSYTISLESEHFLKLLIPFILNILYINSINKKLPVLFNKRDFTSQINQQ